MGVPDKVEVNGLSLLKIVKHGSENPVNATGQLLGLPIRGCLEVSNSFPFVHDGGDNLEAQVTGMLRLLEKANFDANNVGWYLCSSFSSFLNVKAVEMQFQYQTSQPESVLIVYDPISSISGSLAIKAFRLTDKFMALMAEGRFSAELVKEKQVSAETIFDEIDVKFVDKLLPKVFLTQMADEVPALKLVNRGIASEQLRFDTEPFIERSLESMAESVDEFYEQQRRFLGYTANLAKHNQRRRADAQGQSSGRSGAAGDEDQGYSKNVSEPSHLDVLLITNQMERFASHVEEAAGGAVQKAYLLGAKKTKD